MTVELARAPHALLRALAATVLIMSGAIVAHTWAGGHLPGLPALVALSGVVLGAGLLVLRGLLRLWLVLPVVAVAQGGLHEMFGVLAAPDAHAGHAMSAGDPAQWSWHMLGAHALGTVLAAVVLRLCDRALVAVVSLAEPVVVLDVLRRGLRTPARPSAVPSPHHLVVAPRRGPPVVA